jgi:hypothetical protein
VNHSSLSLTETAAAAPISSAPVISNVIVDTATALALPRVALQPGANPRMEMPPAIAMGGWYEYFVSSFESYYCAAPWSLLAPVSSSPAGCTQLLAPVVDNSLANYPFTASQINQYSPWSRNYNGIFSAQLIEQTSQGAAIVAITHEENKGEASPYAGGGIGPFPNTIMPNMTNAAPPSAAGPNCEEANGCYFAGVGMAWLPYDQATNWGQQYFWDAGPIVWPSMGYGTADGKTKLSNGARHPSSIVANGYLYVFYIDQQYTNGVDGNSANDYGDRRSGLKVMRAELPYFQPGQWMVYYNGAFSEDALPSGFTAANMQAFVSTQGPLATPLFSTVNPTKGSSETIHFSVSAIQNSSAYLGVEQYVDYQDEGPSQCPGMEKLAFRVSTDLVNWSARRDFYGCLDAADFALQYPEFMDSSGATNNEIDPADFYVLGTQPGASETPLNRLKVSIVFQ